MANIFTTFDTPITGAIAAIKAAILTSTNWSNPAGDRVVCTTTRGAEMVVDLADSAATSARLQFGVYRTAALADKITRYLYWRATGGATSDTLHVTVAAGKEHLWITTEGPRSGEVNPDNATNGSHKPLFWMCDLVPYFATDTVPAVVCGGTSVAGIPNSSSSFLVHVSRNAANNASWVPANLETLIPSRGAPNSPYRWGGQTATSVGSVARPWVVFEDTAGMRGRLSSIHMLGWNMTSTLADFPVPMFGRVTIGSATYIGVGSQRLAASVSPFAILGTGDPVETTPVIAVPYS